jgi:pimeloyl-ACP methyl ester carboxylesterase
MSRTDAPGPLLRRGPRPLALHLALAATRLWQTRSSASPPESPSWSGDWRGWSPAAMWQSFARSGPNGFDFPAGPSPELAEALGRDRLLVRGIAAYRRHPWRRVALDPPCVWSEGGSRLLDYGGAGPPVLFAPSLVNRAYVLDLMPEHSMLRWLAANGVRPLLLDWGWPDLAERRFTITDYVAGRLERAIRAASEGGRPPALAGYCMGGTLAVAAAQRLPEIPALALLAAPWDFHAADAEGARTLGALLPLMEPAMSFGGALPIDLLQSMFSVLDPHGVGDKYRGFATQDQDGERAKLFVALEDWLNDGVPLAAPVARECIGGWYGANAAARGEWRVAGLPVDPAALRMPTFVAAPARDRLVPPESASPLARLIRGAVLHAPESGHIGMVAGARAEAALWRPLRDWLVSLPARAASPPSRLGVASRQKP